MLLGWSVPPVLVAGEVCGNASKGNTRLRWSRPGIAGEPIVPVPAVMRPHRSRWASRRGKARRLVRKRKDLDVLPAPMSGPGATKRSPSHIDPADRSEQDWLAFNRHRCRWRQETAYGADAARPSAFGSRCQTLLSQRTALSIRLVGQVNGALS
jgi:hypothetical protein